jgi:hypothetical protein
VLEGEKGVDHWGNNNNDHADVIFVGLKFKKNYYRKWNEYHQ